MPRKTTSTSSTSNNKSELNLLLKSIDRRMQDFEQSVEDLKSLKNDLVEMESKIEIKKKDNEEALKELARELELNTLKAIQTKALELGKVIMSTEELQELKNENASLKSKYNSYVKDVESNTTKKITDKIENAKKIFQLENERENARLVSEIESYKKNLASMESLMNRMSQELDSQKKLTAEIAKSNSNNRWNQPEK